jgi:uncharacterized protein (TIGR03790 family)
VALTFLAWWAVAATTAMAGGGPANVLLLVNKNSDDSKTVANHYIDLREIPPSNVVYVDWTGSLDRGSALVFRDKVLNSKDGYLKAIQDRGLAAQIDYVVYSCDFPWAVDLQPVFPDTKFPLAFAGFASLTGVTYLAPLLDAKSVVSFPEKDGSTTKVPAIVLPDINPYVPGPRQQRFEICTQLANVQSRGFRARGKPFYLSTMLGVTRDRGNTVAEIISYLKRSKEADGKRPKGTIYYMWNKDIRSSVRDKCFESMAAEINKLGLGVRAKVQQGRVPTGAKDVAGMMVGTAEFSLANISILPGAICEHLTSQGGIMNEKTAQTSLSEFLRRGAAGASGTVWEPLALQSKFPLASLQLHYVRGCSLAEAFYQSVAGPYQLLIVGDPLCQPWAQAPMITVEGVTPRQVVRGPLTVTPKGTPRGPHPLGSFETFVDGRIIARSQPGKPLTIDTEKLPDGYHELRIVGVTADPIETQGRAIIPITVNNKNGALDLHVSPASKVSFTGKLHVTVKQTGATAIIIRQNSREIGRVNGEVGDAVIAAATLGRGPTTLQAFSEGSAAAVSEPVRIVVE